jgi:pyruvate formate lyase activating enzyme
MKSIYSLQTDKGAQCLICPHKCNLAEGQYGICRTRVNHDGLICSDVYGRLCAFNMDPVEKKPLLHFLPGSQCLSVASAGCNLRCRNCQNWDVSQASPSEVHSIAMTPDRLVNACLEEGCPSIAFTYTEPLTYYEYVYDTARLAHQRGIKTILVSAGYVNKDPIRHLSTCLDAANIDLKSFSDDIYVKLNGAHLQPVLDTLLTLKDAGVWLEITNLLIPEVNDDAEMISNMCHWLADNGFASFPLHFSRFFPMYKMEQSSPTPLETLLKARDIAQSEGMQYVYIGNAGEIEGENTVCPVCHKLIVRRKGFDVLENNIENGTCKYCGTPIPGRWTHTE